MDRPTGIIFSDEDDDVILPFKPNEEMNPNKPSAEVVSLTSSLKRGLKLKDQSDTLSLSGALKKGFRKHVLKSADSVLSLSPSDFPPSSPRNSSRFSFLSPKKSPKTPNYDGSGSVRHSMHSKDSKNSSKNSCSVRLDDVSRLNSYDDTVSLIEGLLVDTAPIRYEDGIRDSIGRKSIVTLKKMVKLERPQGDRTDAKVLVLTPYRCQLLGVKSPFKLEHDFHFLDIKSLDSPSPQRLVISTTSGKIFFMQMIGSDDADHIIGRIALSLRTIFPSVALSRILKASLEPLGRQKLIQSMLNQADQVESGPCGNFSEMYRCICDYLSSPIREDVEWDVDTIYLSQNCREINLKDFDLHEINDMIPIISVMIYNRWFDSLVIKDAKINSDVLEFILKVARSSHNLKELTLSGLGLKGDFAHRLSMKLVDNKESCLEVLDLSNNPLEDKGLLHLSGALPLIKHGGLRRLDFSRAGLSPRGISGLCQSLRSSPKILETLTHLNLSGNWIKGDEAEELINFLSNQNSITDLDISTTECSVEVFISALSKTCVNTLENLKIGRNHFFGKKGKEPVLPNGFSKFFKKTTCLKKIDFSNMKLPTEALGSMLDGLQNNSNPDLAVHLNLSCCELKAPGCQLLQKKVSTMKNISTLDVSENGFDSEVVQLMDAMQENRCIKELNIGKNFFGIKAKFFKRTMESVVELIQEEDSCLESFSVADSKIGEHIHTLLGCLGSNTSLTSLDISGNLMGDAGARVLAKSIQINSRLKILKLDKNNLSAVGFEEIANAMEKNFTLRHIPYPVSNAVVAMKSHPDRTQSALSRIQDLLLRNADENRGSNDQQFRLQKAVTSTAQKVLDKMAEKVDDAINALEIIEADSTSYDVVVAAKNLVKDANNSKQLLSDIYGLAMEKAIGENSPLQHKLNEVASSVEKMVQEHLNESANAMMRNAEAQCSYTYREIKEELKESTDQRCELPPNSVKDFILKNAGIEIINKVSELNLVIATLISDKVTDTLLASLSQSNLALTEQLKLSKSKDQPKTQLSFDDESDSLDAKSDDVDLINIFAVDATVGLPNSDGERRKMSQDPLLPVMRKERAESVARRRQRPDGLISTPEETARKLPRNEGSPIEEFAEVAATSENDAIVVVASPKLKKKEEDKKEEAPEDIVSETPLIEVNAEPEVTVQTIKPEAKKSEPVPEQMEASASDTKVDGARPDSDVTSTSVEFPDAEETKTLEHVTKGRPRGPTRRQRRAPSRHVRPKQEDSGVDGFFQNNVANTDFSEVPTIEEEEEIKRKERIEEKMTSKRLTGMGAPLITPGMLKLKKNESSEETTKNAPAAEEEEKTPEETTPEKPQPRRPKGGAMMMPGMGFGGNILAEMKLKKMSKKSQDNLDVKPPDPEKPDSKKQDSPFGPSMLKKRTEESTKEENGNINNNNNNNNNNNVSKNSSVPFKERFFSKLKPKSDKDAKKEAEKTEEPVKAKPLLPPNKPLLNKPKPPPPPNKPKPSFLRPGNEAKTRPLSELIETTGKVAAAAAAFNRRPRASSVEKDENIDKK